MNVTLEQLVNYVMENKHGKAFENYTSVQVAQEVLECVKNKTMSYSVEGDKIVGIVVGKIENGKFFVTNILTTQRGIVKRFMKLFMQLYPNLEITGTHRSGRQRHFNAVKLLERIK